MDVRAMLFGVCVVVFLAVALTMLVLSWRHHRDPQRQGENFHGSVLAELGWTLTPLLMVVALAWPTVRVVLGR